MIHLLNVSKSYRTRNEWRQVLKPTTLSLPTQRRIGVLGRNGAGKSTFLRVIAGAEPPDHGQVVRETQLSWPIGFGGAFHGDLTGRENLRFISRIYDVDEAHILAFVEDFAELGDYLEMPVRTYSSGMRARLAFGASLSIDFECYLIDEVMSVGDKWFRDKASRELKARIGRAGLLLVSHNINTIRDYCDMAIVLRGGRVLPFENVDDAIHFYSAEER
ncbi:MAG: ABC transporter ATP-binding protein [Magnetospiraceae bacterium]